MREDAVMATGTMRAGGNGAAPTGGGETLLDVKDP